MIKDFFNQLAGRHCIEPDLSDITSFVLKCSPKFRVFFLQTLFPEELKGISEKTNIDIEREFFSESKKSIVDFKFDIDGFDKPFLVENKIYDHDYHEEYITAFPNYPLGFIADYNVEKIPELKRIYGSHKISWGDFKEKLECFIKTEKIEGEEKNLLNGFLEYIRSVCKMFEKRDFYPNKTTDLCYMLEIFDKLITDAEFLPNRSKRISDDGEWFGRYFDVGTGRKQRHYWMGVGLSNDNNDNSKENGNLYIQCLSATNKKSKDSPKTSDLYKYIADDDGLWFVLRKNKFDELNNKISKDKKFEILENFFNETMTFFEKI